MAEGVISFENAQVLVVGDIMLDQYWHGQTSRISPEAPVPVVHVNHDEERLGGAGNVALNIAALGAKANLVGVSGDDASADLLEKHLTAVDIHFNIQRLPEIPTIKKLRVISRHQQLIRLDFESNMYEIDEVDIEKNMHPYLAQSQVVVLSDYGKGTLRDTRGLIASCQQFGVPVLVDPKSLDYSNYHGATMITPNMKEFEAVVGVCRDEDDIVAKGHALMAQHDIKSLLVTRSERGMTLLQQSQEPHHFPAKARDVFDVTGAGDTVIATVAAALAAGESAERAVYLANLAASISVSKLGAATVSLPELHFAMKKQNSQNSGVVNESQLLLEVQQSRATGEKIVMTNGCFDILHAGHIAYLNEAKSLGDRLIVAVNDDDSVKRLKGPGRPINNIEQRMAVLANLQMVDWVVPFSEDTPARVIGEVLPNILVKGGDYKPEEVAGGKEVVAAGGEVRILSFVEGLSTTATIEKAKQQSGVDE